MSVATQSHARLTVNGLHEREHAALLAERLLEPENQRFDFLRTAIRRMTGGNILQIDASHTDKLKMAEYALLIDPISEGVARFVEEPSSQLPSSSGNFRLLPSLFTELTGARVYSDVRAALQADPHKSLIERLATARGDTLSYGAAISPLNSTVRAAALSSVTNTFTAVLANGLAAHRILGDQIDHSELVDITRRSHQLQLARPMVHIYNQHGNSDTVDQHNMAVINGREPPVEILRYDPSTHKITLAQNPQHWGSELRIETAGGPSGPEDVTIGCPLTFSSELLRKYYETMVDLTEEYDLWPAVISGQSGREFTGA